LEKTDHIIESLKKLEKNEKAVKLLEGVWEKII